MMMQRMLLELPHWRAILSILLVKKRKQQPAIASALFLPQWYFFLRINTAARLLTEERNIGESNAMSGGTRRQNLVKRAPSYACGVCPISPALSNP